MKLALTGSSGLVGTSLAEALKRRGDMVQRLVRRIPRAPDEVEWHTDRGVTDAKLLEGLDAVVHLAGESIAARRWTPAQKERIRASRSEGTRLLVESLSSLARRPRVFVSASAVGYYGATGSQEVDETSGPGEGFLPEVCQAWEDAATPLARQGVRVVHARFGVVLSPKGGALAKMLPPFKLGLGGPVGDGRQGMSWIALPDAVGALLHALDTPSIQGPLNAVAPEPCTNAEFTRALGRALHRPALFPLPAFAARLLFGELADDLLLASVRVRPKVLRESGFRYELPEIGSALATLLRKPAP
jgi:uncharacterized protein (TIGR01777 family)